MTWSSRAALRRCLKPSWAGAVGEEERQRVPVAEPVAERVAHRPARRVPALLCEESSRAMLTVVENIGTAETAKPQKARELLRGVVECT